MRLSQQISSINAGGSDGWEVFYRARDMIAAGQAVTELTIGEHDIPTDRTILDAMHNSATGGHTGYPAVPGTDALRRTVADRLQSRTGVATTPDNLLITPGGQAGLFASLMALCDPGVRALFIDPYYATYPGTIRATGAEPVPVTAHADNGFVPRAEDIAAAAPGARALLMNTPNNPTGVVYSKPVIADIARVCCDHDLWLISDEVYDTQVWNGAHHSPRAEPGMDERTLIVGSMSKSHAMTGSRIGWIAGPEPVIAALSDLATNTTYGVPGFIQDAAVFALKQGRAFEDRIAAPFRRRRDIALNLLEGQNLLRPVDPDGAMYIMLDVRATGLDGEGFANRLLDEAAIAVMPGKSFGAAAAGHIRVAMTVDDTVFAVALSQMIAAAARWTT
ncbi:MAG: aminotransferase class I/II-fold pyridoxal phosphate-dependent enzyme [Rhodobacteraceae bacterium]|nr:aminotransferase class I/II-fold pyridoxal phosphate-dependent enzyme [Paracoccaceae bacterium]